MTDTPAHGCTIDGQPAMPILVADYNQLVARATQAEAAIARVRAYAQTAIDAGDTGPGVHLGRLLLHLLDAPPADDTQPTRHVHVTIRHPDGRTADRAAFSLVDFLRDQFPAHHVTTDAREWEPSPAATEATEPATKEN